MEVADTHTAMAEDILEDLVQAIVEGIIEMLEHIIHTAGIRDIENQIWFVGFLYYTKSLHLNYLKQLNNMAKFNFLNLDKETKGLMLLEIENDQSNHRLYISDRLNDFGKANYPNYLIQSIKEGDEESFEKLLDIATHFNSTYLRQGKDVKMPSNASTLLCQSEFNRYYIRAVCQRAINNGIELVEIYRARESSWARPESEAKIGSTISAKDLLADLKESIGAEPKLFPEINSGLCVKI